MFAGPPKDKSHVVTPRVF